VVLVVVVLVVVVLVVVVVVVVAVAVAFAFALALALVLVLVLVLVFLRQMVEKSSHHRSGIPIDTDGVHEHLLIGIEFRANLEFDIWHIVHSLNSYMPIFPK